ncbi:golgin candidate 5-like [Hordeum vulgare subsp. vulgare]|uniref:TATA element modulatory factor 1 TATA binding domain-containing protein n=1 Tax=Hordeum vulgare subsp. vulgare TaxID=112509 RepID=A0A8I6WUI4_HORVV|nr:golgin candidate 5-like [Hordeum vulgare subsp. vulgare]
MAWWSDKLSLGGLQDIAGAVNKISESVKNIEKNFDSALGLEEKRDDAEEGSGSRTSNSDGIGFFNPVMAFMGHNGEESSMEVSEKQLSPKHSPALEENHRVATKPPTSEADASEVPVTTHSPKQPSELQENVGSSAESHVSKAGGSEQSVTPHSPTHSSAAEEKHDGSTEAPASEGGTSEVSKTAESSTYPSVAEETHGGSVETSNLVEKETQGHQDSEYSDPNDEALPSQPSESVRDIPDDRTSSPNILDQSTVMRTEESVDAGNEVTNDGNTSRSQSADSIVASSDDVNETKVNIVQEVDVQKEIISPPESSDIADKASHGEVKVHDGETNTTENGEENDQTEAHAVSAVENEDNATAKLENISSKSIIVDNDPDLQNEFVPAAAYTPVGPVEVDSHANDSRKEDKNQDSFTTTNSLESVGSVVEVEKLKRDMKMMEAALQGAARQSQSKADEIARLMNENEQLKSTINELKGNKSVEEEMDALKDEYHQRVATLERKVYALTKERDTLRREQNKKSDAAALLKEKDEIITQVMAEGEELSRKQAAQEATIRKLRAQIREFEEEKQRLNSKIQVEETKVESIKRDKAATEKLLQETIERNQTELAAQKEFYTNALNAAKEAEALAESRVNTEAKAELESRLREACEKENMLINTIEELRNALTRQEQEAAFREERLKRDHDDLQKRYQASELRYNELVTQVPESTRPLLRQIEAMQESAARREEAWAGVERTLNSRLQEAEAKAAASEEKERSINERLSQNLSRITVLETQITILRTEQTQLSRSLEKERQRASESRQEYLATKEEAALQEGRAKQLEEEIKELRFRHKKELQEAAEHRALLETDLEREKAARAELEKTSSHDLPKIPLPDQTKNAPQRKLSSVSSMEESHFLQASLDLSDSASLERRTSADSNMSYYLRSMTPSAFESALRQKDGELASYMSRLASLESIRNSLAEELVKLTEQCEKLRSEAAALPGLKAELEALKQRHFQALELMGERDEELEELRNDIVDLKDMYREQVDLLVSQLQTLGARV